MERGRIRGLVTIALALVMVVASVTSPVGAAGSNPPNLMPLGDSNTDGYRVPGGYRIALEDLLVDSGFGFDLVGSLANGPAELADRDHEGHVGATIADVRAGVAGWLAESPADTVLLMVGTNDLKRDTADPDAVADEWAALIDHIASVAPSVHILATTLPPMSKSARSRRVIAFNERLPGIVAQRASAGVDIDLIDAHPALRWSDLIDGIHLTRAGYDKLAAVWHQGILDHVDSSSTTTTTTTSTSSTTSTSTTTTSTTTTTTTTTVPGTSAVVVDGFDRSDGALGSAPSGHQWSTDGLGYGIVGGKAALVSGGGEGVALVDAGVSDAVVSVRIALVPDSSPGLSLRAVDKKNQLLVGVGRSTQEIEIYKIAGGKYSALASVDAGLASGSTYLLSVALDGPSIIVSVDGVSVLSHTLSASDQATFGARTGMGLRSYSKRSSGDGDVRWDDFRVDPIN